MPTYVHSLKLSIPSFRSFFFQLQVLKLAVPQCLILKHLLPVQALLTEKLFLAGEPKAHKCARTQTKG